MDNIVLQYTARIMSPCFKEKFAVDHVIAYFPQTRFDHVIVCFPQTRVFPNLVGCHATTARVRPFSGLIWAT